MYFLSGLQSSISLLDSPWSTVGIDAQGKG